jgi:hypothetical protein
MLPFEGQKNWKGFYKFIAKAVKLFAPRAVLPIHQVGKAMINAVIKGYLKPIIEIADIKKLAQL